MLMIMKSLPVTSDNHSLTECVYSHVSENEFLESMDYLFSQAFGKGGDILEVDVEAQSLFTAKYDCCHRDSEVTSGCCTQTNIESNLLDAEYSPQTKASDGRNCFSASLLGFLDFV